MARTVLGILLVCAIALVAWTMYANVYSSDAAVRADAEKVARERAGCGSACKVTRIEGSRGVFDEQLQFTLNGQTILIVCKRPYIGFGAYRCS